MNMDDLNHIAILAIKTAVIVVIIIVLFNSFEFIDKKMNQFSPKLPRFVLYILIAILSLFWILIKLISFRIIKP